MSVVSGRAAMRQSSKPGVRARTVIAWASYDATSAWPGCRGPEVRVAVRVSLVVPVPAGGRPDGGSRAGSTAGIVTGSGTGTARWRTGAAGRQRHEARPPARPWQRGRGRGGNAHTAARAWRLSYRAAHV
ncbi:hypothetical protein GCM10010274_62760 [Streptomyces lavendofoliae]|uniref:Uncharacterized protein n=1 Tax=Streptomyces lavendofoliae TaxID=67314 RepID=A0A918M895_9ACTN|nr:hypothetical protein GCM10010274_62760 [Streptomyces lavendofoliae]